MMNGKKGKIIIMPFVFPSVRNAREKSFFAMLEFEWP